MEYVIDVLTTPIRESIDILLREEIGKSNHAKELNYDQKAMPVFTVPPIISSYHTNMSCGYRRTNVVSISQRSVGIKILAA